MALLDRLTKNNQFSKPGPMLKVNSPWLNYIIDKLNTFVTSEGIVSIDTINELSAGSGVTVDGVLIQDGAINPSSVQLPTAYGTAATGITTTEYGDGRNITVTCSFTAATMGAAPTAAGSSAHGRLIHTLPNATILVTAIACRVGFTVGTVQTDTPDVGLGTVIATGAVALLDGTGTFEDIITGQTWNKTLDATVDYFGTLPSGVVTEAATFPFIPAGGAGTAIHLNAADGWAAGVTGNLTATGIMVINYILLA